MAENCPDHPPIRIIRLRITEGPLSPTFRRIVVPSSSGSSSPRRIVLYYRHYGKLFTIRHGATSHKTCSCLYIAHTYPNTTLAPPIRSILSATTRSTPTARLVTCVTVKDLETVRLKLIRSKHNGDTTFTQDTQLLNCDVNEDMVHFPFI